MAAPARRVLAGAIAAHLRPIEYALDTSALAARRLRLLLPNRLQDFHYQRGVYRLHRQRADGPGMGRERRRPLRRVLAITPSGTMHLDVGITPFPERFRPGALNPTLPTRA